MIVVLVPKSVESCVVKVLEESVRTILEFRRFDALKFVRKYDNEYEDVYQGITVCKGFFSCLITYALKSCLLLMWLLGT